MSDRTITRRTLLVGGGASLAMASCAPQADHPLTESLRDSGLTFLDGQGNPVNIAGLQARLNGNPYTVSFQFASCGDICPITGAALGKIAEDPDYAKVKHVVISSMPMMDITGGEYGTTALESMLFQRSGDSLRTSGPNANTIVLYPSINGNVNDGALFEAVRDLQQRSFDLPTGADPMIGHTGTLLVYDGSGNRAGQVDNPGNIPAQLPPILDRLNQQAQVRN